MDISSLVFVVGGGVDDGGGDDDIGFIDDNGFSSSSWVKSWGLVS